MRKKLVALAALSALIAAPALADEGMWTFDNFPSAKVGQKYGFTPTPEWLSRVQKASVRLTSGCSASVVSKTGLVLTNHHCIVECAQNLSDSKNDFVANGFMSNGQAEERQCPGMQAEILFSITDVSAKVKAASAGKTGEAFIKARDAAIAQIEQSSCEGDKTSRCQVLTLYRGGEFKLYRYRKYADVRLVFAPEFGAAFFGGDPDNFNFPRFALDSAFVRLYENGKPIATNDYLPWNAQGSKEGDLVFVSGNPGSTDRLKTIAQLKFERDWAVPIRQLMRSELRGRLIAFGERGAEQKRISTDPLFGVENSYKAFYGRHRALLDASFFGQKVAEENALKAKVMGSPALRKEIGDPWGEIDRAMTAYRAVFLKHDMLEARAGSMSELFHYARALVRAADERSKANGDRLPEYGDAKLALLEKQILDATPIYPELEEMSLAFWMSKTREYLTADDASVKVLLGKDSPEALAARLVKGTKLSDPAVRKALWDGGAKAIAASTDPMIVFARTIDADARDVRKTYEAKVGGPIDNAAERIARARFAVYGAGVYPDATFSLRLSYGQVKGWTYGGQSVPWNTTFQGLFDRATGADPFVLPARWAAAKDKLNPNTVFDVVTTNDIIGGNSGSPLIDQNGAVVGAVFDGNIHSLGGAIGYDGTINRTVAVSTSAITEALRVVYGRDALLKELMAQ